MTLRPHWLAEADRHNLVEFLLARIAEEEAWAEWLETSPASTIRSATNGGRAAVRRYVLAECEAKRRIVELFHVSESPELASMGWQFMKLVLREFATPYADHPDYDESWRP